MYKNKKVKIQKTKHVQNIKVFDHTSIFFFNNYIKTKKCSVLLTNMLFYLIMLYIEFMVIMGCCILTMCLGLFFSMCKHYPCVFVQCN